MTDWQWSKRCCTDRTEPPAVVWDMVELESLELQWRRWKLLGSQPQPRGLQSRRKTVQLRDRQLRSRCSANCGCFGWRRLFGRVRVGSHRRQLAEADKTRL